jgi:PAS domain S-box-containing protein
MTVCPTTLAPILSGFIAGGLCTLGVVWLSCRRAIGRISRETIPPALTSIVPGLRGFFRLYSENMRTLSDAVASLSEEREVLNERYSTLTDNLAAAVIIRDMSNRIIYCSPYTEVLTGYSTKEIYATTEDFFRTIIHQGDLENYQRALKVSEFGEAFQVRYRILHKTGIEMWAESRTVPVLDETGEVVASLSITLDVTGTVRYQRQVEEQNRDLHDFTYMVSHDLKAPIFTIKGMVGVIEEDFATRLDPDLKEILGHISQATRRLDQLVTGVLHYSRVSFQENALERIHLVTIFDDIKRDTERLLREVGGALTFPSDMPELRSDRLKLYQIFSNLVGNSIKYREPTRPLMVAVDVRRLDDNRSVAITVSDNGVGIPSDKFEAVFRPFQRAHTGQVEGSGIGLATVKKLVEKLGGEVTISNSSPAGTTITVVLRGAVL